MELIDVENQSRYSKLQSFLLENLLESIEDAHEPDFLMQCRPSYELRTAELLQIPICTSESRLESHQRTIQFINYCIV